MSFESFFSIEKDLEGITVCMRFNLKTFLSKPSIRQSRVLTIGHSLPNLSFRICRVWLNHIIFEKVNGKIPGNRNKTTYCGSTLVIHHFLGTKFNHAAISVLANFPISSIRFGNPESAIYMLENTPEEKRAKGNLYEMWTPYKWESFCIAFNTSTKLLRVSRVIHTNKVILSKIKDLYIPFIQNGHTTNINFEDPKNQGQTKISKNLLSMVFLGRCSNNFEIGCHNPEG